MELQKILEELKKCIELNAEACKSGLMRVRVQKPLMSLAYTDIDITQKMKDRGYILTLSGETETAYTFDVKKRRTWIEETRKIHDTEDVKECINELLNAMAKTVDKRPNVVEITMKPSDILFGGHDFTIEWE